jgi:glutamine synthetase
LHQVYGLPEIEEASGFLRDLWATADAQGVPLEGVISEYAPGQLELTLKHRADVMRACDEALMYKRAAKGVALKHGREATFMAKPFADFAGSGFHIHVSFNDAEGRNLCASEDLEGSSLLKHAIGGMRALLSESMAIFAPNANSYRRFKANSYAPVAPTWGVNNRTVSLRVPAGPATSRHVEHRVAGADAQPHLALAAVLAAAHHGITHKLDPGPRTDGNGYAEAVAGGRQLRTNWFSAVDRFEESTVLRDYLGDHFVEMFAKVKRIEQDRFFAEIPLNDFDWCLRNA